MEQRHQVYIIARAGLQYRVLAAVDQHHLFASAAVAYCLRLLQAFSNPSMIPWIRRELYKAGVLDWNEDIWADEQRNRAHEMMFTTIAKCLLVNTPAGATSQPSLMPINWHFDGQEILNDDWITIIDITELGHPRYAFMHPDNTTLVDARAYSTAYQASPCDFDAILHFNIVSPNAVRSTWPGYDFKVKVECEALDLKILIQHL